MAKKYTLSQPTYELSDTSKNKLSDTNSYGVPRLSSVFDFVTFFSKEGTKKQQIEWDHYLNMEALGLSGTESTVAKIVFAAIIIVIVVKIAK